MKKKRFLLLLILISVLYSGKVLSQPEVGQSAPALSGLKMINKDFPDIENKFVFLDFWATYSSPEVRSLDHLNILAERFKKRMVFLAVSEENEEQVRSFLQNKLWFNIYFGLDIDLIFHKKFKVEDIPVYYLISPDNIILATGISDELQDYKLDSIVNKVDSIRMIKTSRIPIFHRNSKMIATHLKTK
jgi:thiol-disulfide isomerase/thioredoxin